MVAVAPRIRRSPRWSALARPKAPRLDQLPLPGWTWIIVDEAGIVRLRRPASFATREDAEDWLVAHAASLMIEGVAAVVLHDGERVAYGPIRLDLVPTRRAQ
jgi:hypothetical protein